MGISAVENAFSLWQREAELERPLGVAFMPYGVLGGVQHRDGRRSLRESFPRLVELADARHVSPESLTLAWVRQRFPCVVHIVGARSLEHILDCAASRSLRLTTSEVDEISSLKPARAKK